MEDFKHELMIAAAMLPLGAIAGLAAFLRSKEPWSAKAAAAVMLNSAIFSSAFCMLMFWNYGNENTLLNIGMSLIAGLGGNTAVGIGLKAWAAFVHEQGKDDSND
jgi:disulfide bond formation protein DsbB